jgi:hypothetical protein
MRLKTWENFASFIPGLNLASFIPGLNLASFIPGLNLASFIPGFKPHKPLYCKTLD